MCPSLPTFTLSRGATAVLAMAPDPPAHSSCTVNSRAVSSADTSHESSYNTPLALALVLGTPSVALGAGRQLASLLATIAAAELVAVLSIYWAARAKCD